MNHPFEVFQPHWGSHGAHPLPPPHRPRQTAHPYQGARTKRAFGAQRQLDSDGTIRTGYTIPNAYLIPDDVRVSSPRPSSIADAPLLQDILSQHVLELERMFPSRPPEPLGPGMGPVMIYEESIEEPQFILDCIKAAHKQRVAEMRLRPKRKRVTKKKCGGRRVLRRAVSVDAMDVDRDDIAMHSPYSLRAAQSLSNLSFFPVVAHTAPCTPTAPRAVPDYDEEDEEDEELIAAEFDREYRATLEKAQQMQV